MKSYAHYEEAPKQVQFTVTPIANRAVWLAEQINFWTAVKTRREAHLVAAKERAIAKFLEENKTAEAWTNQETIEYNYRKTKVAYLKYVDKHVSHTTNQVICTKCSSIGIVNHALGKEFYYCRTCRDEI